MSFSRRSFLKALMAGAAMAGVSATGIGALAGAQGRSPAIPDGHTHWMEPIRMHRMDMQRVSGEQGEKLFHMKVEQAKRRMRVGSTANGAPGIDPKTLELGGPYPMHGGGEIWYVTARLAA